MKKKISVIAGPTASGKSSFGIKLAQKINGCILNADSMQIYQDLKILSARPGEEETKGIVHLLYGYADSFQPQTVVDWLKKAVQAAQEVENPIFVGGTGMYIGALINGISPIPDVDEDIRALVRRMPLSEVKKQVKECSAVDSQRLRRALEVQLSTKKTLSYFQSLPKQKYIDADFDVYFIHPDRALLYQNAEKRFDEMISNGAIEEVRHLLKIQASNGVLGAIGVAQIKSYLNGEISFDKMVERAKTATRQYAKRQVTWFKHQLADKKEITDPIAYWL